MKVLYISGMYPTPAYPQKGIFCHEQVKALKRLGVEVDVAVPVPFYDRELRQSHWEYEGVPIRYVRFFKLPGARDFQRTGKNLFPALDRVFDLAAYDLYHADAALPSGQAAMLAGEKYGKPFVVHGHGLDVFLDVDYNGRRNVNKIVKSAIEVYKKCDAFIGVSQKVLKRILERLDIQQKCYVVYNGVNPAVFSPNILPSSHDDLKIISVGNLIDLKGHDISIRAVAALAAQGYRLHLDIYGRGEKEDQLRRLADELNATAIVSFQGYIPQDELANRYREYDVFLLPSWYEAIGCVYLEAMCSGLISIGCWENGIDEVIRNGENGFLVNAKNVDAVIDVLKKVIEMPAEKRNAVSKEGRKTILEQFTWAYSAQELSAIYEKVVSP